MEIGDNYKIPKHLMKQMPILRLSSLGGIRLEQH
jgi:hypothetical protein